MLMESNDGKIGAILKSRIKEMGYSQEHFASLCEISISTLKRYCNGESIYSVEMLKKFSNILDCSTDYLLGRSNYTTDNSVTMDVEDFSEKLLFSIKCIELLLNELREHVENLN